MRRVVNMVIQLAAESPLRNIQLSTALMATAPMSDRRIKRAGLAERKTTYAVATTNG